MQGDQLWGTVEVCFPPVFAPGLRGILALPSIKVTLFATVLNLLGFLIWLRRCVRPLDASAIVPQRVRTTLDTMAEAVVVLDLKQRIVTANSVFSRLLGEPLESLSGRPLQSLPWVEDDFRMELLAGNTAGLPAELQIGDRKLTFVARSSQVTGDDGRHYGTLLSFANVTALEEARSKIEEKNQELEFLATRDPLTSCLNRRSFFDIFAHHWEQAQAAKQALGCVMVDIDHFKSINDTHGHAMGDEVLREVSATLRQAVRSGDHVCRYGGEEFCILLPGSTLSDVAKAADRYRRAIERLEFARLSVTASLGCSERSLDAENLEMLLEQADRALYAAKTGGRNQVIRFDQIPAVEPEQEARSCHQQDAKTAAQV